MFKIKFVDDVAGYNPEEIPTCDISNKQFLCRIVEKDPLENTECSKNNVENNTEISTKNNIKKLIIKNINTIDNKSKKKYNIIYNGSVATKWRSQIRHRKRCNECCGEICV